jgi:hypothetical protein
MTNISPEAVKTLIEQCSRHQFECEYIAHCFFGGDAEENAQFEAWQARADTFEQAEIVLSALLAAWEEELTKTAPKAGVT